MNQEFIKLKESIQLHNVKLLNTKLTIVRMCFLRLIES